MLELGECSHTTVIKDMCAECGADLRQDENVSFIICWEIVKCPGIVDTIQLH